MTPSPRIPLLAGAAERLNCVPEGVRISDGCYMLQMPGTEYGDSSGPVSQVIQSLFEHSIMLALMKAPHCFCFSAGWHDENFEAQNANGVVSAPTLAELLIKLTTPPHDGDKK